MSQNKIIIILSMLYAFCSVNSYSMEVEPDLQCFNVRSESPEEAANRLETSSADPAALKENLEPYIKLYQSIGKRTLFDLIQCDEAEEIVEFLTVHPQFTLIATPNGKSLFHLLARYNSFETIRRLATIGLNHRTNQTIPPFDLKWLIESFPIDKQSNTSLMDAVDNDSYEAAQELMKIVNPADDFKNKAEKTTYDLAKTPRMRFLLRYGSAFARAETPTEAATRLQVPDNSPSLEPYIHLRQSIGNKTLLELIAADDYNNIVKFLTAYPHLTAFTFTDGKSLFHILALYNSHKTIRHLASLGKAYEGKQAQSPFDLKFLLDIVPIDGQSNTPLMDAAENDSYEAAQELLAIQGNAELKNKNDQTAFALAKTKKMRKLLRSDYPFTLRTNTPSEIVKSNSLKLIVRGAPEPEVPYEPWYSDPTKYCKDRRDKDWSEPINHDQKVKQEQTDEKIKLEEGTYIPDTELGEGIEQNALTDLTTTFNNNQAELISTDCSKVLQDHATLRPYSELFESIGHTPLLNLIKDDDYKKIFQWWSVHPTYLSLKTNDGKTLFHLLARHNSFKTIRFFGLKFKAEGPWINALDNESNTPLMDAVEHSSYEAARELIKFTARTDLKNKDGYKACDLATDSRMSELFKVSVSSKVRDEQDKIGFERSAHCSASAGASTSSLHTMRSMSSRPEKPDSPRPSQSLTATSPLSKTKATKSSINCVKEEPKSWSERYPYLIRSMAVCALAGIGYGIYTYCSRPAKA